MSFMNVSPIARIGLALLAAAFCTLAAAQAQKVSPTATPANAPAYVPQSGQAGKDVVWVPTPQALVDKMLDMARVTPIDYVIDLGSGDGRTVITAAKRGARALGIEYNPELVALSKAAAEKEGVAGKASFVKADIFQSDFSRATVITMFLLPSLNLKLRPQLLDLKPGTRIVSNSFSMDTWEADDMATLGPESGCTSYCTAYFWLVPAKVAGTYRTPKGEVSLKQTFQMLTGTLTAEGLVQSLVGRVRGEEIAFKAGGREYRGRMNGNKLEIY
jgi:SAM-dependent methyltransferase